MIEVYSKNVTVDGGTQIPLNDVSVLKGKTAALQGSASIVLNKCGVYKISVSANVTPSSAGTASIQMEKNGALAENAISQCTAEADTEYALGFTTLVQVSTNNDCCCSAPTTLSFVNGLAGSVDLNVVVDKIV